jgi:anti-sigma factor RsiW
MTCQRRRDLLLAKADPADLAAHFESCPECARFAARWEGARRALGERAHPVDVAPPPAFARRIVAQLSAPAAPEDILGRLALRMLPAAVVLALALAWVGLDQAPLPATSLLAEEPSPEALLTYSVLAPESAPAYPVRAVRAFRAMKTVGAPR